jgi:hypothetical protein
MSNQEGPTADDRRTQKGRKKYEEEAKQVGSAGEGLKWEDPTVASKLFHDRVTGSHYYLDKREYHGHTANIFPIRSSFLVQDVKSTFPWAFHNSFVVSGFPRRISDRNRSVGI